MAVRKKPPPKVTLEKMLDKYAGQAELPFVKTDSLSLDKLFSLGFGMQLGKYYQFYSPQGVGKTTAAVWIAIALAAQGYRTLFMDIENALEPDLIYGCGGREYYKEDNSGMIAIVRPATFAQAEDVLNVVIPSGKFSFVVVDSISAMLPSVQLEISVEACRPGLKARLESLFLQKYKQACRQNEVTILFLNQMRASINFKGSSSLGPSGSNALKFYCDAIFRMSNAKPIIEDGQVIGSTVIVKADKNKKVPPFMEYPLHIIFGVGISDIRTMISLMFDYDLIEQRGAWYLPKFAPEGTKSLQGNQGLYEWVRDNRDFAEAELRKAGAL